MTVPIRPDRTKAANDPMNEVAFLDRVSSNSLQSPQSGVLTLPFSARYWRSHSLSYSLSASSWFCINSKEKDRRTIERAMSANPLMESEGKSLSVPDSLRYHELHYSLRDVRPVAATDPCGGYCENLGRDV